MKLPDSRSTRWTRLAAGFLASLALAAPAAADGGKTVSTSSQQIAIAMSTNAKCDGVRDLMVDTLVYQMVVGYGYGYGYGYYPYGGYYGGAVPDMAPTAVDEVAAKAPAAAPAAGGDMGGGGGGGYEAPQPSHYTTTNVQEQGVDEGDIVKTDGKYVYTLRNNELVIAKTWPVDKAAVAARVTFKTITPAQLYLHGDDVIVEGWASDNTAPYYGTTRVLVIDAKDHAQPSLKRIVDLDGSMVSSRVVGNDLYMVQNGYIQVPQRLSDLAQKTIANIPRADQNTLRPWEVQAALAATLRQTLNSSISQSDIDGVLPKVVSSGKTFTLACSDMYVPPKNMQLGMTVLTKIGLDDKSVDSVGAMLAGGQIYASTSGIYVTAPYYSWTNQGYADYGTQIHEFSIGDGKPTYVASGKVAGTPLNQFSLSEYNGDLRIATTAWNYNGNQQQDNNLFVLRASGKSLKVIGSIRGLAKNEQIYAGRMFGDKGYLVTFRQTDPLFTLDLSDPTKPKVAGELKVNGYSSYIHPMGNDLLLTIGQDATDTGQVTGMQLQVFDVSNPAKPTRKFQEKVNTTSNYAWSAAQNDHHAFTYDPVTGTLAIPLSEYNNDGTYFNGMVVYDVDKKDGFSLLGKLDHGALADVFTKKACADAKAANNNTDGYVCGKDYLKQMHAAYPIDRSMVMDKYLVTMSQVGLEIHALKKLDKAPSAILSWTKVDQTNPQMAE